MSLQIELNYLHTIFSQKVPPDVLITILDAPRRLVESRIAENSLLKVGEKASDFNLPTPTCESASLRELLEKGSVVLNFYRGGWGSYCNLELNAYQMRFPE